MTQRVVYAVFTTTCLRSLHEMKTWVIIKTEQLALVSFEFLKLPALLVIKFRELTFPFLLWCLYGHLTEFE